jgi:3-oxoacyl-[acyl-carrier protein] reductase
MMGEQRVAIVTGGASGMGRATAELLTRQGVTVEVFDVHGDGTHVDVSDAAAVNDAVAGVHDRHGRIDILVNCAGVAVGGAPEDPDYVSAWELAIAVNLTGLMYVCRAAIPHLIASGAGRIVNIASTEALAAARRTGPYSVSKHAVVGYTRTLAVDLGRRGVTANCVCPGPILTGMTERIPEEQRSAFARRSTPVGRYGSPEEVAYVIVALTDAAASYINGAVIPVDGGMTAMAHT